MPQPTWTPRGVPFCWQPKEALKRIEQNLETSQAATAKLIYLALTRIASDSEVSTFQKPISYIATLASLSRRTVERRLPDLERLGLVAIKRGELRVSHQYTLATLSRNDTSDSRSDATGMKAQRVALIEELKKVPSKEKEIFRIQATEILEYLNQKANRKFRPTDSHLRGIANRLKEPGINPEQVKVMIDRQVALWKPDPKMVEYLTPETLFRKTNFDRYYDLRGEPVLGDKKPSPPITSGQSQPEKRKDPVLDCL